MVLTRNNSNASSDGKRSNESSEGVRRLRLVKRLRGAGRMLIPSQKALAADFTAVGYGLTFCPPTHH